jgi:hypothetical protein
MPELLRGCQETVRILRNPQRSITIARRRRNSDRRASRERRLVTGWSTPEYMAGAFAPARASPAAGRPSS